MWEGDDLARPLSKAGWKQANAVCKRLAKKGATELVSSPYERCLQTLEPLAVTLGRVVRPDDRLLEEASFEGVLDLIGELPDGAVMCSHGDVIPATIQALVRRGMEVKTAPDWRKGTVWVLKVKDDRVISATVWPPPT